MAEEKVIGKRELKWRTDVFERISKLSNDELLVETIEAAAGDDETGCFIGRGLFTYNTLLKELSSRLQAIRWLEGPIEY